MPSYDANAVPVGHVALVAGSTLAHGQVTVAATATQIVGANTNRYSVAITNSGSATIYLGKDNTVTTSTGFPLTTGQAIEFLSSAAVWGIVATSTQAAAYIEEGA